MSAPRLPGWFQHLVEAQVVVVVRSRRSRRARLAAEGTTVRLVLPARGGVPELAGWLESHRAWVERHAAQAGGRQSVLADCSRLPSGAALPGGACRMGRREAGGYLARLVAEESGRTGLIPTQVTVRSMRSRWGSCSTSGRVSLNWRLGMAPETVARYVVVHELAHLRHLDHSPRYWAMVGDLCPGWKEQRSWLSRHGWLLLELPDLA